MGVELSRTKNGITLITDRNPHLETVSIGVWINVGSRSETPEHHGITHLLEHMAFKGTKRRSAREIAEEIEAVGGELNASTNIEHTTYFARVLKEDVEVALDILSDILIHPAIDSTELEREKHVILQEIGANKDSPEDHSIDIFQQTAWPDQPIGRPILGTPDSVISFTPDDIREYLVKHYQGPNTIIAVAGAVNKDSIAEQVDKYFARMPTNACSTNLTAQYVGGEGLEQRNLQEVQINLGFEGFSYHSDSYIVVQMLAAVLGGGMSSRLFQEVRERRGLCYAIGAFHWAFKDTGLFAISTATGEEDVRELMPVIIEELKSVTASISEEEVARARAQIKASLMMALESPVARAAQLARQYLVYGRVLERSEIAEKLDSVNAVDLSKLASNLFESDNPTLSAVGPVESLISRDEVVNRMLNS